MNNEKIARRLIDLAKSMTSGGNGFGDDDIKKIGKALARKLRGMTEKWPYASQGFIISEFPHNGEELRLEVFFSRTGDSIEFEFQTEYGDPLTTTRHVKGLNPDDDWSANGKILTRSVLKEIKKLP